MEGIENVRQGEHRSVLTLSRTEEGLVIQGEPPAVHLLATSFVDRGIAEGDVEVLVKFAGVTYAVRGYERNEDGTPNNTSWVVELVED